MNSNVLKGLIIGSVVVLMSCEKEKTIRAAATATVQLENATSISLTENKGAPDELNIIVLYARLFQDVDDNNMATGLSSFIYINPDCRKSDNELNAEQQAAGQGATIGPDEIDGCAHQEDTWISGDKEMVVSKVAEHSIDMALGSDAVNEILNAQRRMIDLGDVEEGKTATATYKRLGIAYRVETHKTTPNVSWSFAENGVENQSFVWAWNEQFVTFDEPISFSSNERAIITLSYDLAEAVEYGAGVARNDSGIENRVRNESFADNCVGTMGNADYTCLIIPDFNPSVSKL